MSRAESFLRGGRPCTEVPELIDVLSTASKCYTHWRFVAYYPQRWLHDAVENRTTAPVYFLVFACAEDATNPVAEIAEAPTQSHIAAAAAAAAARILPRHPDALDASHWHLLCYTVLPSGAVPRETFLRDDAASASSMESVTMGGGGVGALRTLLRTLPAGLHPSASLEWFSVADGAAYTRMGLLSEAVFNDIIAPAVADVLHKHWKANPNANRAASTPNGGNENSTPATAAAAGAGATVVGAHYVRDGRCVSSVDFRCADGTPGFCPAKRAEANGEVSSFVRDVVGAAVAWMNASPSMAAFITDASVPALPEECRDLLYPVMTRLPSCLYTSLFVEAEHANAAPPAALVDPETLTGLAKLRAERDAGIAQWKKKIGEYASFTIPESSAAASNSASAATDKTNRPFQHVILLQRPIEEKKRVDVDNRDPGPLAPQPIGAELHLLQDRGDVQYTLDQLGNRSNIHFLFSDTLPSDGEVLVQLTPVEGTPFSDLEAYFASLPEDAAALISAPASQCVGSCCGLVVPRVLYRRPTGQVAKANPIATAQTEIEVLPPTAAMVAAAVAALDFVGAHAEALNAAADAASRSAERTSTRAVVVPPPQPGYTLRVAPVDLSLVPSKKCGWCGRRREVLLRCGGCKAVSYCCKRDQALDWKEGTHKVECKLWKYARELQEHVVAPWAAHVQQPRRGSGWSCMATLVQFLKDVQSESTRRGAQQQATAEVRYIHVAGFDASCADDFIHAAAEHFSTFTDGAPQQYRILVCADAFTEAQRNAVWAVRRAPSCDADVWLTPSTGALGDAWHCGGANTHETTPAACVALIRFYGVKYHNLDRNSLRGGPGGDQRPSAVLSFGPLNGDGCSYLTAALEVFAGEVAGVVPLRLADSSFVGAVHTRDAFAARVSSCDSCPASAKARVSALVAAAKQTETAEVTAASAPACVASGGPRVPLRIVFNDVGAAPLEVAATTPAADGVDGVAAADAERVVREERAGSAVPHYVNSYLFDLYPSDV